MEKNEILIDYVASGFASSFRLASPYPDYEELISKHLAKSSEYLKKTLGNTVKISGLFNAIQEERGREMLAEGTRLFDLKRWGQGFKRDINAKLAPLVDQVSYLQTMKQTAGSPKFVWPIPNSELTQNPNFGSQNQGYL